MPELNANTPAIECFVRGNYLRDQKDSHDLYFPCIIFGVASIPDRVPMFHFIMEDGGIWWRMPPSAFCQRPDVPEPDIHDIILWNSFSPYITVTRFNAIADMRMRYTDRNRVEHSGKYLFTLDWHSPDGNIPDLGYSENVGQHKCGHVIALDDGNFAIQPNNRVRIFDPSFTVKREPVIHRLINTHKFSVEDAAKWVTSDNQDYDYQIEKGINK
jgi:hypothetical protein